MPTGSPHGPWEVWKWAAPAFFACGHHAYPLQTTPKLWSKNLANQPVHLKLFKLYMAIQPYLTFAGFWLSQPPWSIVSSGYPASLELE